MIKASENPSPFSRKLVAFLPRHAGRWYCDDCVRALTGSPPGAAVKPLPEPYQRAYDTECSHCGRYRTCTRTRRTAVN